MQITTIGMVQLSEHSDQIIIRLYNGVGGARSLGVTETEFDLLKEKIVLVKKSVRLISRFYNRFELKHFFEIEIDKDDYDSKYIQEKMFFDKSVDVVLFEGCNLEDLKKCIENFETARWA